MKKVTLSGLAGFILRNIQVRTASVSGLVHSPTKNSPLTQVVLTLTASFLILGLLMQCFIFNPMMKTNAQTKFPVQETAPVSAPPIGFEVQSPQSQVQSLFDLTSNSIAKVSEFFSVPRLPEGFENAKTVSPFAVYISSIGESLSSVLAVKVSALSQPSGSVEFDFDGDDKADLARWRGSAGDWQIKQSSDGNTTNLAIGSVSSVIVPGDFDGDGTTDRAVFNAGTWTIKKSSDGQTQTISFGISGDKPVTGDYDGDGISDAAVFRASTNTWWILNSGNGNYYSTSFGASGDITAQGNYDGDSKTDIAVFRPSTGDWHILGSSIGYFFIHWGIASDIPVPADFDGDGKTDAAVYRGSTGTWYVYKSSTNNGEYLLQTWGNYGDQPAPADFDGDNKADFAVFRPTTGVWHIIKSSDESYDFQTLGIAGDTAVSSAYLKQIGGTVLGYDLAKARLSPKNATGGTNLYSRNFSWGTGIVGLSGRAGMDAGFGISYNSLIWTKSATNNSVVFDADNANISPGFRFGFPTIEPTYYNSQRKKFAYLMVLPSGSRVEFNQIGASDIYETSDSSYTQLKTIGASDPNTPIENIAIVITTTDGSTMSYEWKAGAFRCSQIKDRNGNYISINHDSQGVLRTVTDTLGRVVTVNYDSQLYPTSITQTWKNSNGAGTDVTHTYASFTYTTATIDTDFSNLTVIGPADGTSLKVLQKITFASGSAVKFYYQNNSYGQVYKIENIAEDSHVLNYVRTNLETISTSQTDCPRFTETYSKTENFNGGNEILINNSITENQSYTTPAANGTATKIEVSMTNDPHGAVTKTFVGSTGWQEGLPIVTEDYATENSSLTRKRWTWTSWTQDDTSKSYIINPRITESKVGDTTNIKRSTTEYYLQTGTNISTFGLVKEVKVYAADETTIEKKSAIEYNLDAAYISRRIIGLPAKTEAFGLNQSNNNLEYVSKVTYNYDEGEMNNSALVQDISPIQHDNSNFSASVQVGRGNLTSVTRHDVTGQTANVTTSVKYNAVGAPVEQTDVGNRKVEISYADAFNDTQNSRNTFAYPTKLTEVAGEQGNNYSSVKYRFDTGANVWAKSPKPENNTSGKETTREFDAIGRLQKEILVNTGAYTRYEYPANAVQTKVYTTVIDTNNNGADSADEVASESWSDGAGRVLRAKTEHPTSAGNNWAGTLTEYDILGRVTRSTIPTEINANYEPAGDDYRLDAQNNVTFLWKHQKYDWKSRVVRIINTDGVDSPTLNDSDQLFSYEGCGCAGGQITTVQGELVPRNDNPNQTARRTQKIYADILGRTKKTEILNWDNSVYTTTTQIFNGRDQVLQTRQYAGAEGSLTHQDVTMSYDGHGRMKTRHYPIEGTTENPNASTSWIYNNDDSIQQVIDPRNAITTFSYNSRGLMNQINYTVPSPNPTNIPVTPTVNYTYDSLGNRISMTDGLGSTSYEYSPLSQLTSETRNFSDSLPNAPLPDNGFRIEYGYNLSGGLKFYKDPFGQQIDYANDKTGRLTGVTGSVYGTGAEATTEYADTIKYRAWGAIKSLFYRTNDNSHIRMLYDNRLRVNQHEIESYEREGNFVKKATFSYLADSRVAAMNNLVNTEFNRTYSYDQVGRLTANHFGLSQMTYPAITPYEQTVQYDAFSQMTNRNTTYWGENTQFNSTFTNGREQTTGVSGTTYDAAGNMTNTGERAGQSGVYQATRFDVANRRMMFTSRSRQRSGRYSYIYTNRSTLQYYDGDGHALKQMEQLNNTPLSGTEKYQIWSSILQSYLTEADNTGKKVKTKVFAGGAVIAEQMRRPGVNNTIIDEVVWIHADPVSGSSEYVGKTGAKWYRKEYEPLGNQEVSIYGLEEDFPEPQHLELESQARAEEPQWQCQAAIITGFNLPISCQIAIMQQPDELEVTWGNPLKIGDDAGDSKDDNGQTAGDEMPVDPTSTDKPQGQASEGQVAPAASTPTAKPILQKPEKTSREEKLLNDAIAATGIYDNEAESKQDNKADLYEKVRKGKATENELNVATILRGAELAYLVENNMTQEQRNAIVDNKLDLQSKELSFCHAAQESSFDGFRDANNKIIQGQTGGQGELGLFQIKLDAANEEFRNMLKEIGEASKYRPLSLEMVRDNDETNTALATYRLQRLINGRTVGGVEAVREGLAAYNMGEFGFNKTGFIQQTQWYADSILQCEARLQGRL